MIIKSAEFITSNIDYWKCPQDGRPEYAFIGRSNVGKSSLINALVSRKGLALTSSTPGKTLFINHFLINNEWYLVDLPGYGYAHLDKKGRKKLNDIIQNYILYRAALTNLFVLVDCRLKAQANDMRFISWLGDNGVPFSIVFTKADKLSKLRLTTNVDNYKRELLNSWEELPPIFITSALKKEGREELLDYVESINKTII